MSIAKRLASVLAAVVLGGAVALVSASPAAAEPWQCASPGSGYFCLYKNQQLGGETLIVTACGSATLSTSWRYTTSSWSHNQYGGAWVEVSYQSGGSGQVLGYWLWDMRGTDADAPRLFSSIDNRAYSYNNHC